MLVSRASTSCNVCCTRGMAFIALKPLKNVAVIFAMNFVLNVVVNKSRGGGQYKNHSLIFSTSVMTNCFFYS